LSRVHGGLFGVNHGYIRIKLAEVLEEKQMSRTKCCQRAEMQLPQLNRYYFNKVTLLDIDVLARLCNALDCRIEDLLEFVPEEKQD